MVSSLTYRDQSRAYLEQANEELQNEDLLQASKKGWEAAAHIVKAVAEERGWEHKDHWYLHRAVDSLVAEAGDKEFWDFFALASNLDINFYEDWLDRSTIAQFLEEMALFVEKVEALLDTKSWGGKAMVSRLTYRDQSRAYLEQANEEFQNGDLLQASKKGWGAAAQILKAVAEERGWDHDGERELHHVVSLLVAETGDREISGLFASAFHLRINFYEDWLDHSWIAQYLEEMTRFVEKVEALLHQGR